MAGDLAKRTQDLVGDSGSYHVVKRLGLAGATSHVYQLKRKEDEKFFALKLMQPNLSREMKNHFQAEMVNLQRLRIAEDQAGTHHIPKIIESSDLDQPKTQKLLRFLGNPFIIMEFADGIDIHTLLIKKRVLSEEEALNIAKQFAQVLLVIHGEGLTYTDMKMSNLIWNVETQHLVVIDWNVIAENRLEADAPKDRLQAAAYLFHMAAGIPLELDISKAGAANQKYRRMEEFKNLSQGTQLFLKKAFHQDPLSRHGEEGTQLQCTREFLKELKEHWHRFKLSTEDLISEGEIAFRDRQWEDAVLYLDLAARKLNIEEKPAQFIRLQEILEKSRSEANKLGRNAFYSGHGRYKNGLFNEALKDFKKAMQDDPYDEEARLYAILTQFAIDQGEEIFLQYKEPLEECIGALLKGHFDMADNALNRIPGPVARETAVRSLKAELIVRSAVKKGQRLLKEDKIKEAHEFFSTANQEKDHILYVQPLEENLGSLTQLYHDVEELGKFFEEGKACIKQERFREAVSIFLKAREISQGSPFAERNFQFAAHLNKIKKFLEEGRPENAFEQCNHTSRFDNESVFRELKKKVSQAYVEQLRVWADQYFQAEKYIEAKETIMELLKHKPDDEAAKVKLDEIDEKIEGGGYLEFLKQMKNDVERDISLQSIDIAIDLLKKKGYEKFREVRAFIQWAEKIKEEIILLSEEFQDKQTMGGVDGQLDALNKAIKIGVKLKQGEPEGLKRELLTQILENKISESQTHLIYCQPQSTLDICKQLPISKLPDEKRRLVEQTIDKANQLLVVKEELENLKKEKIKLTRNNEASGLEKFRLEENHLRIHQRMKQIEPELKIPLDLKEYDTRRHLLLQDLQNYTKSLQFQGQNCLMSKDFDKAKKIASELEGALTIFKNSENGSVNKKLEKLRTWNREFSGVVEVLEKETADWAANYRVLMTKLLPMIKNPRLKQVISILNAAPENQWETQPKELEELENLRKDSPAAFWFYEFFDKERKINRIWRAMAEDSSTARELILQYITDNDRGKYEKPLSVVKEVEGFLNDRERIGEEKEPDLKKLAEHLEQGTQLRECLREIPELIGKEIDHRLATYISSLRQTIFSRKNFLINEHVQKLEDIFEELFQSRDEQDFRFRIEDKAKKEIEELRNLNETEADKFLNRLNDVKAELSQASKKAAIKEHAENLETILTDLSQKGENPILRQRLEDRAASEIEKLKNLNAPGTGDYEKRLHRIVNKLLDEAKKVLIKEYSENLETTLRELEHSGENHISRIHIEDKANDQIEKLRELDQERADQFNKRLEHLLEKFLDIIPLEARKSLEDLKHLGELQRRVCERYRNNKDIDLYLEEFERIPRFKNQINDYKKRHENVLYKLKRLKKESGIVPLESLLKLREEYGEFPGLDDAIKETGVEMSREDSKDKFDDIYRKFPLARSVDEWEVLKAELEKIDPQYLNELDRTKYAKMKSDIEFHLIMNEPLSRDHLLRFLENGEAEYMKKRINALERNVFQENARYAPLQESLSNIDQSERLWFNLQKVNIENLQPWRWIKFLTRGSKSSASPSTNPTTGTNRTEEK